MRDHLQAPLHGSVWPLLACTLLVDATGDVLHFYSRWNWYDQFAHMVGGFVTAFVIWRLIQSVVRAYRLAIPTKLMLVLAYVTAQALGAAYEIEEYLEDLFTHSDRLGNGADTANDLLMNLMGATFAVVSVVLVQGYRIRIAHANATLAVS